jgi:hypothetical protein
VSGGFEAAALGGEALITAISPDGDRAVVLTRMPMGHELHRFCVRTDEGWELAADDPACSPGTCWDSNETGGTWHVSGQVPAGVKAVKLRWTGEVHEIPVKDRRYLTAWWDLPQSAEDDEPELVGYVWGDGVETPILA